MIRYFIYLPLNLICMILCYITNPIVVLFFCNGFGELPGIFHLWQTWDDSCDSRDFVTKYAPKWLRYDYDYYYTMKTVLLSEKYGKSRRVSIPIRPFPFHLMFKRYLCRVAWLYRNCGYGFAFYLFGINVNPKDRKVIKSIYLNEDMNEEYATYGNIFKWYNSLPIKLFPKYRWRIYLGWKINTNLEKPQRAMIANRIWFCKREDLK